MRRERLKDQIENPRVSFFDTLARALVVLISLGAIYYALSGRGRPIPASPTPSAASVVSSEPITLMVTKDHTFYWNREGPFALDDFGPRLAASLKGVPAPQVVITADASALLADALRLLNETRHQGVTNVRLEGHARP